LRRAMSASPSLKARAVLRKIGMQEKDERLSLPLRVNASDLYDYEIANRAIFKEIAQLQRTIEPEPAPWINPEFETYIGWCHAKQDTLARRVGCDVTTVERAIARFKADGTIIVRHWRDKDGHKHAEYQIVESVVDTRQRPEDGSRKENPSKRRSTSFSKDYQPTPQGAGTPHGKVQVRHPATTGEATPQGAVEGGLTLGGCLEGVKEGVSPSAGSASPRPVLSLREISQNQPRIDRGVVAKQNQKQPRPCVECLGEDGDHHKTCKQHPKNLLLMAAINKPVTGVAEL
jgi:single-stranded DNA-binding protein